MKVIDLNSEQLAEALLAAAQKAAPSAKLRTASCRVGTDGHARFALFAETPDGLGFCTSGASLEEAARRLEPTGAKLDEARRLRVQAEMAEIRRERAGR